MGRKNIRKVQYTLNPVKTSLPMKEIRAILRGADPLIATGGRTVLAKILKGSRDKKVLEYKLDNCPAYGFYKDLTIEAITGKIDRVIKDGYLRIEYDYRLPVLVYSEAGWEIEKETYANELFKKLESLFDTDNYETVNDLKDKNRGMIFLLLDRIAQSGDRRFLPILEYWKGIDYKKVRARIDWVIGKIWDGGGGE